MATHRLAASPETARRGAFDAAFPPVLTVDPGDTVIMQCVSGNPAALPPAESGLPVPPALSAILDALPEGPGPHIVTGPVAVAGAEPGDMLEVSIDAIAPGADWGFCAFHPGKGTLPDLFPASETTVIPVDRRAGTCRLPWGPVLPLAPFFGIMATAPDPALGRLSTREPRAFGGNLDCALLTAGTTLFLPVFVPGANFTAGDGHGMQGDGEVCVNALEMCLDGTFTLRLHKGGGAGDPRLRAPRAETPTDYVSFGLDADLDVALRKALLEMMDLIGARTGWSPAEAYKSCSLAVDFRVTQNVNGEKGVHGVLQKGLLFD